MSLFKKVAIVGTGLIGGSIALAIKKNRLAREIVGVSRHNKSLTLAKKKGAIDKGSRKINIIKGADLLILATPVNTIINSGPAISRLVGKNCIVTDVGSTKKEISSTLGKIFPNYVGSHPLAGSQMSGIINAEAGILKNSLCILTPTVKTNKKALNKLNLFWHRLGVRTILLSPEGHDKILAFVSHLPHAAAFSLIDTVPEKYFVFASGGLKDTTRVSGSSEDLWADIFLSNKDNIVAGISQLQGNLSRLKSAIQLRDRQRLIKILSKAKTKRQRLDSIK